MHFGAGDVMPRWWDEGIGGSCFSGEEVTGQTQGGGLGDLYVSHQYTGYALSDGAGVCTIWRGRLSGSLSTGPGVTEKLRYAPVVRLNI